MEEINQRVEANVPAEDTNADYIAAIQQLKENSVDKARYDKLREENKRLTKALVDGSPVQVEEKRVSIKDAAARAFEEDNNKTNLARMKDYLAYREAVLKEHGVDVLLPNNNRQPVTQKDIEEANYFVDAMTEMIEYANGDPRLFDREFERALQDTNIFKRY